MAQAEIGPILENEVGGGTGRLAPQSQGFAPEVGSGSGAASSVVRPFEDDPLGLVAHYTLYQKVPTWKVMACDIGTGYYLPNPAKAIASWGPPVKAWFGWASGGTYTPVFEAGAAVAAETQEDCVSKARATLNTAERNNGTAVIVMANTSKNQGGTARGWGLSRLFKVDGSGAEAVAGLLGSSPYVRLAGSGIDEATRARLVVHEMGHALGLQHVPLLHSNNDYSFVGDVMSGGVPAPTHVFNLYRLGWVPPERVVKHTENGQVVEVRPHGTGGTSMVVIADNTTAGRLYAVGVNPGKAMAGNDTVEGVVILAVDQSLESEQVGDYGVFCPTTQGVGMCASLGAGTRVVAPKGTPEHSQYRLGVGQSATVAGVGVEVVAKTAKGYRIKLVGAANPFWPRGYDLLNPNAGFWDVPAGHLFESEVTALADSGVTKGCNPPQNTRFCPDAPVTRGQMAAFLVRMLGLAETGNSFADMGGHLFEVEAQKLAAAGITKGCNPPANDRFCPDTVVTRGQMAAFLVRALGLAGAEGRFSDTGGHLFDEEIAALAAAGITKGCNPPQNTRFCPDAPVTRGQMAAFLIRAQSRLP